MTDIAYSIGDFFTWTFGILTSLENLPNYLFIVIGIVGIAYWLRLQKKYTKADKEAGRLV